jgi:hypothetical protein
MPSYKALHTMLHIGAENELSGTIIKLKLANGSWSPEPYYGENIAKTADAHKFALGAQGGLSLPRMSLQPDGVQRGYASGSAKVEIVGGPRQTQDDKEDNELRAACKSLVAILAGLGGSSSKVKPDERGDYPLANVLKAYNDTLPGKDKNPYALFECETNSRGTWYVFPCKAAIQPVTQMNFEIPFRNIGHMPLDGENASWDPAVMFKAPKHRSLFIASRKWANFTIDGFFVEFAAKKYYENKNVNLNNLKLDKLRSLFTLYLYIRAVECSRNLGITSNDKNIKDRFDVLPKTATNDIIRTVMSDRDRQLLINIVTNATTYKLLKAELNEDIQKILDESGFTVKLADFSKMDEIHDAVFLPHAELAYNATTTDFTPASKNILTRDPLSSRYKGETDNSYGVGVHPKAKKATNDENRYPSSQLHLRPDTPTFKPIDANTYDITKEDGTASTESVIVFETRHNDHPLSQLGDFNNSRGIKSSELVKVLTAKHLNTQSSQVPVVNTLTALQTPYYATTPRKHK